jgi:hypothetical protein
MTRSILVLIAVGGFVSAVTGSGCSGGGVGDPCVPEQEYQSCFAGFQIGEVNVESKSFQCQTRLCLVNHFQGRVSCPYGQTAGSQDISAQCGTGVTGGSPIATYYPAASYAGTPIKPATCTIPGGSTILANATTGETDAYQVQLAVPPQVFERNTSNAVYCSCRCANDQGQTNDGAVYCQCPDNYTCTQLVTSIGGSLDEGLTGGYCMKTGTGYLPSQPSDCSVAGTCCSPNGKTCGKSLNDPCTCD